MYKVTNKAKDVRKFRDKLLGQDIHLSPGETTFTERPPKGSDIWKVELVTKVIDDEKKIERKKLKGGKRKDDSSSNR